MGSERRTGDCLSEAALTFLVFQRPAKDAQAQLLSCEELALACFPRTGRALPGLCYTNSTLSCEATARTETEVYLACWVTPALPLLIDDSRPER